MLNHSLSTGKRIYDLPQNFREKDVLSFYNRDKQDESIHEFIKGLMIEQQPAKLVVNLAKKHLTASLEVDLLNLDTLDQNRLIRVLDNLVTRVLGLKQPIELLENQTKFSKEIVSLLSEQRGLRITQSLTVFDALMWAIIGQLISVKAASSIKKRLNEYINIRHSSGILCDPTPKHISQLTIQELRTIGLTQMKANCIKEVSTAITNGHFIIPDIYENSFADNLIKFKGIGKWTVNYVLLRGYGYLDADMGLDIVVRNGIKTLTKNSEKLTTDEATIWLSKFSPFRGLIAAHIWSMQSKIL